MAESMPWSRMSQGFLFNCCLIASLIDTD